MCGRINVSDNEGVRLLLAMLGMEVWPSRDPRFNIAPSQSLDVVTWQDDKPIHRSMKWGLLPAWAPPGTFSAPLINARSETIHEKPSFKKLVRSHRVLIPVNGFYEWRREGKMKAAHFVQPANAGAMFVGGLFQPPMPLQGQDVPEIDVKGDAQTERAQVCVVTVKANESMSKVHHRMPVILTPDDALTWIQPSDQSTLDKLMVPASNDVLKISEVSDYVNSARNEGPECVSAKRMNDLFD